LTKVRSQLLRAAVVAVAVLGTAPAAYAQPDADAFNPGVDGTIYELALQPDRKVIVVGVFVRLGGGGFGSTPRSNIARLNADGSLDQSFDPGANSNVFDLAIQPDGKILVAGFFTRLGGGGNGTTPRSGFGRLNPDGSLDTAFDPAPNGGVGDIAVQADGKILVTGSFTTIGGGTAAKFARLHPDGSLDTSFNPSFPDSPASIVIQPDGRIIVATNRTDLCGGEAIRFCPSGKVARVHPDGSLDFLVQVAQLGTVHTLALQRDGKILVGGGALGWTLKRLNVDGSPDGSFRDIDTHGVISTIVVQQGGRILVGGEFSRAPDVPRSNIARFNANGVLDLTFDPGADGGVTAVAAQADGKILVSGYFRRLGGGATGRASREGIGRLENNPPDGHATRAPGDIDGDGVSDLTVFRPADGVWYSSFSRTGATAGLQWGNAIDKPVAGDYDGDGLTDRAVFRPANGVWYIHYSGTGATAGFQWGNAADVPVPGDFNGGGQTDIAVFRPSNGVWYVRYSETGQTAGFQWGSAGDSPVAADYDGDGATDIAVFRRSEGIWYLRYSASGSVAAFQWGSSTDVPVPADYDGDDAADLAVYRPANGTWYLWYSGTTITEGVAWGTATDIPTPGDYDGDGLSDFAFFRPSAGTWSLSYSSSGTFETISWGDSGDLPIFGSR
jgi:uncharacterized delta-60 repeat protein